MKKIIISLSIVAAAAAVVVYGTTAFFSDTETSTGNTFTAGAIDLKIDSTQHFNGNACIPASTGSLEYVWSGNAAYPVPGSSCNGSWLPTDLGATNQFFYFADLKPGDNGENTISLNVSNNNAWACAELEITADDDMTCTTPEMKDDTSCSNATGEYNGEMAKNLAVAWWPDDGDNIMEPGDEYNHRFFLDGYKLANLLDPTTHKLYLTLADSLQSFFEGQGNSTKALTGGQTYYVGAAWCFGDMTIDPTTAVISCNGGPLSNEAQTDQLKANLSFSVFQERNNLSFRCVDSYKD